MLLNQHGSNDKFATRLFPGTVVGSLFVFQTMQLTIVDQQFVVVQENRPNMIGGALTRVNGVYMNALYVRNRTVTV